MKIKHVVLLVLSLVVVSFAAKLANSGYPTYGANAQRNFKSSRPLACSSVSKGKTTILRDAWHFDGTPYGFTFSSNREPTVDDKGFIYVVGPFPETPLMAKIHINGTFYPIPTYEPSFQDSVPTLVEGSELYLGGSGDSARVNTNTMTQTKFFGDAVTGEGHSSYVPFGPNLMVKTNQGAAIADNAFTYYSIANNVETTGPQIVVGSPQYNVIVYNNSGSDIAIAVGDTGSGWKVGSTAWAPISLDRTVYYAFVSGNELVLLCGPANDESVAVYRLDAATGQDIARSSFTTFDGGQFYVDIGTVAYQNNKTFAAITFGESSTYFVDLINTFYYGDFDMSSYATFITSSDNIVLATLNGNNRKIEFAGYDWDTGALKVRGRLPVDYTGQTPGTPFISENCNVHIVIDSTLYTVAPMPLQNVVPILECVDANGFGYFAYNNLEANPVWIPKTIDRNMVSGVNSTAVEEFAVGRSPYYPLSNKLYLGTTNGPFTWVLEDYTLTFTVGPSNACPTTINLKIKLTADAPFPPGFNEVVRTTFVNVTGISDSRVTIVAGKRDVSQTSTLETELAIAPDNTNTEPSPQDVVSNFVTDEVQSQFVAAINSTTDAPPVTGLDLTGKSLDTEVQGVLPPPVAAPVEPPVETPVAAQPKAVPISGPTSSAAITNVSIFLSFVLFVISYL